MATKEIRLPGFTIKISDPEEASGWCFCIKVSNAVVSASADATLVSLTRLLQIRLSYLVSEDLIEDHWKSVRNEVILAYNAYNAKKGKHDPPP